MNIFKTYRTFNQVYPDFLKERKIVLKDRTYTGYVGRIALFSRYLIDVKLSDVPLRKITNQDIARFFAYLASGRGLDKPTCQKYYVTIKKIWEYASKIGEVDKKELPFDLVVFPSKKGDFSPELIPKEVFEDLVADMKENDPQLHLAAMIQYYAFIRPGTELRKLKVEDFNFEQKTIRVSEMVAKTKITRYATITKDLFEILIEYEINKAPKDKYVFGKKERFADKHVGINSFSYRFRQFKIKYKLHERVRFYSFKHTGITDMLNSGMPLIYVQAQAGHSRLSSTQHYAKKYGGIVNQEMLNYQRITMK